jgi:hypothetical protein
MMTLALRRGLARANSRHASPTAWRLFVFLAFPAAAACASSSAEPEGLSADHAPQISDIASMTKGSNGTFTVTCTDGRVEQGVTADAIARQDVCNGSSSPTASCVTVTDSVFCEFPGAHYLPEDKCCTDRPLFCTTTSDPLACEFPGAHYMGNGSCCSETQLYCSSVTDDVFCGFPGSHLLGATCCSEHPMTCTTTTDPLSCEFPGAHYMGNDICCVTG